MLYSDILNGYELQIEQGKWDVKGKGCLQFFTLCNGLHHSLAPEVVHSSPPPSVCTAVWIFTYFIHLSSPKILFLFLLCTLMLQNFQKIKNENDSSKKWDDDGTQVSPMAQGMHGGSLDWSLGVISCKQWSWKMWPQGRTATAGGIAGWKMCPSGAYETSLLHIRHLSPLSSGDPSKPCHLTCGAAEDGTNGLVEGWGSRARSGMDGLIKGRGIGTGNGMDGRIDGWGLVFLLGT